MSKPLIRRIFSDSQYEWMLRNLPRRIMFVERAIDTQHTMWFPRWGVTEGQMERAKKWADEMMKKIKWVDEKE